MFDGFPDLMTIQDLRQALQIGRSTAYNLVSNGTIPALRIGKCVRIPKIGVIEYIVGQCDNDTVVDGRTRSFMEVIT